MSTSRTLSLPRPTHLMAQCALILLLQLTSSNVRADDPVHLGLNRDQILQQAKTIIAQQLPNLAGRELSFREMTYREYPDAIPDITVDFDVPEIREYLESTERHDIFNHTVVSVYFWPTRGQKEATARMYTVETRRLRGIPGLRWSISNQDADELRRLLDEGIDLDLRDERGETPLFWALSAMHGDIAIYLIERGADASAVNNRGTTPLMYAARMGLGNVVTSLIKEGVDVNARDNHGNTALHNAASRGQTAIAMRLLESGAEVNAVNSRAQSPLHRGIRFLRASDDPLNRPDTLESDLALIKLLIEHGADPRLRDTEGHTPQDIAVMFEALDIASYLEMIEDNS